MASARAISSIRCRAVGDVARQLVAELPRAPTCFSRASAASRMLRSSSALRARCRNSGRGQARGGPAVPARHDVLQAGHVRRRGGCSGRCGQFPAPRSGAASCPVMSCPWKSTRAALGPVDAGHHVEHRGLARAVGADEAGDLSPAHLQVQVVHRRQPAEDLGEALRLEDDGLAAMRRSAQAWRLHEPLPAGRGPPCRRAAAARARRAGTSSSGSWPRRRPPCGSWRKARKISGKRLIAAAPMITPGHRAHAADQHDAEHQAGLPEGEALRGDDHELGGVEVARHARPAPRPRTKASSL